MIITLRWSEVSDKDIRYYRLKKTTQGADWGDSEVLAEVSGTAYQVTVGDATDYIFYIKAVDTSGNESATAASWEYSPDLVTGSPMGLLLSLTYS